MVLASVNMILLSVNKRCKKHVSMCMFIDVQYNRLT